MRKAFSAKFAIFLLPALLVLGCGSGQSPFNRPLKVVITPSSTTADPGVPVQLTATVTNDFSGHGVAWSIDQKTCGRLCSGFLVTDEHNATYTAPTNAGTGSVTIIGASLANGKVKGSVTLTVAPALAITPPTIPGALVGTAYTATLAATGGVPAYAWNISSGSLPPGLTLDQTSGTISGIPFTAGSYPATAQVSDADGNTSSTAFTITVAPSSAPPPPQSNDHDSALSGHYAFVFTGYQGGNAIAEAGSFQADGKGGITGGVYDISGGSSSIQSGLTFTGTYTVSTDNRGTVTAKDQNGNTLNFALAVTTAAGQQASVVHIVDNGGSVHGSGIMRLQDTTAFNAGALNGTYVFGLGGQLPASAGTISPAAIVGVFTANGISAISSGRTAANIQGKSFQDAPFTGTYTAPDATSGIGTASITLTAPPPGIFPGSVHYYVINASDFFLLVLDSNFNAGAVAGEVRKQTSGAAFAGKFVTYEDGQNFNGTGPIGGQTNALVALYSSDASGNCTLQAQDQNQGGSYQTAGAAATSTPCPVAANGGYTLGTQIGYLYASDAGFYLENNAGAALGYVQPQSSASIAGTLPVAFGSISPGDSAETFLTGTGSFAGTSFTGTEDISTSQNNTAGTTVSLSYSVDANGRVSTGSGSPVMYVLSSSRLVWIDTSSASAPGLVVVDQQQ